MSYQIGGIFESGRNYAAAQKALRKRFVQIVAVFALVLSIFGLGVQLFTVDEPSVAALVSILGLMTLAIITLALAYNNRMTLASLVIVLSLAVISIPIKFIGTLLMVFVMVIVSAAALTPLWVYVLLTVFAILRLAYEQFLIVQGNGGIMFSQEGLMVFSSAVTLILISGAMRYFIITAEQISMASNRTAELLQATADIGQVTSRILNLDDLFNQSVDLIRDRFAFYHVQVFLVDDERKYAKLVASTGEVGQRLLARGHKLEIGSSSVIGRVTQIGETVVAGDTDGESVHAVNELLPNTRSELALPIVDGTQIIGALDVQSTRRNAFNTSDIQALQIVANQLATSIRNARSFEKAEAVIQTNQRMLFEEQARLRENERLNRQLSKQAWQAYLDEQESAVGVKVETDGTITEVDWSSQMIQAVQARRPVTRVEEDKHITAIPILLRGEVLGAIEIAASEQRDSDLIEMAQAVAQNLATSLDTARLFEEVQAAALQEQRINTIVERYQEAATVDELLQITMNELSETFGSEVGSIRLGNLDTPSSQSNGKKSGSQSND